MDGMQSPKIARVGTYHGSVVSVSKEGHVKKGW